MVRLHNELLESIDLTTGGGENSVKVTSGRDFFFYVWKKYKNSFANNAEKNDSNTRKAQIDVAYSKLWKAYESEFAHYFRSLYNIFKFIENSNLEDKKFYTNIVRAQLSGQELLMVFYNCIAQDNSKFVKLIEDYALLKHIPSHAIPCSLDFEFYSSNAFNGEYPHLQLMLENA